MVQESEELRSLTIRVHEYQKKYMEEKSINASKLVRKLLDNYIIYEKTKK